MGLRRSQGCLEPAGAASRWCSHRSRAEHVCSEGSCATGCRSSAGSCSHPHAAEERKGLLQHPGCSPAGPSEQEGAAGRGAPRVPGRAGCWRPPQQLRLRAARPSAGPGCTSPAGTRGSESGDTPGPRCPQALATFGAHTRPPHIPWGATGGVARLRAGIARAAGRCLLLPSPESLQ